MIAHGYIRVSSRSQDHAMQRHAIEAAAAARGDEIPEAGWYAEKRSAKTMARPMLDALRQDVRAGVVRRLYVFRLDRLSRTGIRDTLDVVEECRRCGCEIVSLADGFSLDGPAADIILAVMAWASQMERLAINCYRSRPPMGRRSRPVMAIARMTSDGRVGDGHQGAWWRSDTPTMDLKAVGRSSCGRGAPT